MNVVFKFPLLGIFRWSRTRWQVIFKEYTTFNSRYLGFSVEASMSSEESPSYKSPTFNSRYLGFSVEASIVLGLGCLTVFTLSIPVTWDFPLKLNGSLLHDYLNLQHFQFPLLGIFRWSCWGKNTCECSCITFNSRYLGFSVEAVEKSITNRLKDSKIKL